MLNSYLLQHYEDGKLYFENYEMIVFCVSIHQIHDTSELFNMSTVNNLKLFVFKPIYANYESVGNFPLHIIWRMFTLFDLKLLIYVKYNVSF